MSGFWTSYSSKLHISIIYFDDPQRDRFLDPLRVPVWSMDTSSARVLNITKYLQKKSSSMYLMIVLWALEEIIHGSHNVLWILIWVGRILYVWRPERSDIALCMAVEPVNQWGGLFPVIKIELSDAGMILVRK